MSKRNSQRAELFASKLPPRVLLLGLVLVAAACKQSSEPLQPAIFTNPNEVTLACFDADADDEARDYADAHPTWDRTLPLRCCNGVIGPDALVAEKLERCSVRVIEDAKGNAVRDADGNLIPIPAVPVPHALVTQVQRGEVAAVNLEKKVVLDSDRQIPGYTFIDVGGLPTAIAIPPGLEGGDGSDANPPLWTYVAGRQSNSVRAVPTCHFGAGRACGPEVAKELDEDGNPVLDGNGEPVPVYPTRSDFDAATERALAGEPFDMVVSADGKGLWISLPDAGLLAYVPLPSAAQKYTPFPEEIVYYPLPGGFDLKPAVPERETEPYRFACAFGQEGVTPGDDPTPWQPEPLQMPLSVPAESTRVARPTLLRMVDFSPRGTLPTEARKLLFVVDAGQMALHVYAQDEEGISLVTSLPVGAPLQDFAITPEVPALAPTYAELIDGTYAGDETNKRYLYAIDARDGSVMAFALSFVDGVPELKPLLAPESARDSLHRVVNRADRLSVGGEGLAARALDVVDTRARKLSDGVSYDDAYCHVADSPGYDDQLAELEDAAETAQDAYERAESAHDRAENIESLTNEKIAERDYVMASEAVAVLKNADSHALRGVFLSVATTTGALVMLDVHDLDLQCRVKQQCAVEPDLELGVIIQRHAVRLSGTAAPTITVSPSGDLADPECPVGYVQDDEEPLCVSADPWTAHGINFSVNYEASITGALPNGVLEAVSGGRVLLKAPAGVDLCARGANAEDHLLVGITSPPDDKDKSEGMCPVTSFSETPVLRVLEARRDELLLEPIEGDIDRKTLFACYREFVAFDLRLEDQYYVSSTLVAYQHNNFSAADGTCVRDESLDARFTSRAELNKPFTNQFVAFTLTSDRSAELEPDAGEVEDGGEPEPDADGGTSEDDAGVEDAGADGEDAAADVDEDEEIKSEVNPSITVAINTVAISAPIASQSSNPRTDSLPHRVRYFPDNSFLFVVDQASQGLRRFLLTPLFKADEDSVFR